MLEAGAVGQDVDRPELAHTRRDQFLDPRRVGEVGVGIGHLHAVPVGEPGPGAFDFLCVAQPVEHDGAAPRRERIRDGEPNAAGSARHQRGLVAEHLVFSLPQSDRQAQPRPERPVAASTH